MIPSLPGASGIVANLEIPSRLVPSGRALDGADEARHTGAWFAVRRGHSHPIGGTREEAR